MFLFPPRSMPPPRERRTTPLVIDIDGRQLSTSIDEDSGTHYINCHRCGDSITLTITGHPRNFYNHNGNVCKRNSNLLRGNNPSQSSEPMCQYIAHFALHPYRGSLRRSGNTMQSTIFSFLTRMKIQHRLESTKCQSFRET